jgi:hypothetical protein
MNEIEQRRKKVTECYWNEEAVKTQANKKHSGTPVFAFETLTWPSSLPPPYWPFLIPNIFKLQYISRQQKHPISCTQARSNHSDGAGDRFTS